MHLVVRTRRCGGAGRRRAAGLLTGIDSGVDIYRATTFDDHLAEALTLDRILTTVVTACAAAALVLAMIGVYGVVGDAVRRRTPEIGLRVALGAPSLRILQLVFSEGLPLSAAGSAAGIAVGAADLTGAAHLRPRHPAVDLSSLAVVPVALLLVVLARPCCRCGERCGSARPSRSRRLLSEDPGERDVCGMQQGPESETDVRRHIRAVEYLPTSTAAAGSRDFRRGPRLKEEINASGESFSSGRCGSAAGVGDHADGAVRAGCGQESGRRWCHREGVEGRVDSGNRQNLTINDSKLAPEGAGFRLMTGAAGLYWNPANMGKGDYSVKATFDEPKQPYNHPHPYGVFIGGKGLDGDAPQALYCAAYRNGNYIVRGFSGGKPFAIVQKPAPNDAVAKAAADAPVKQEVALRVAGDKVECTVNGTSVWSAHESGRHRRRQAGFD